MSQRTSNRTSLKVKITYAIIGTSIIAAAIILFYYARDEERKNLYVDINGFKWSKMVLIDPKMVNGNETLIDFPILLEISGKEFLPIESGGYLESSRGFDILFLDEIGNILDHETIHYNADNGTFSVWVKLPHLSRQSPVKLSILYGNEDIHEDLSTSFTWENDYAGVWHLDANTKDMSRNHLKGENIGAESLKGNIGQAFHFTGRKNQIGTLIHIDDDDALDLTEQGTIEAWVYVNSFQDWAGLIYKGDKTDYSDDAYFLQFLGGSERKRLSFGITDPKGKYSYERSYIDLEEKTWYHVAFTWNQTKLQLYVNGYDYGSKINRSVARTTDAGLNIGSQLYDSKNSNPFDGRVDEIRLSNIARSQTWIATSFRNQQAPKKYVKFGQSENWLGEVTP